ncbi:MAG: ABC transporter permease [Mycobacteriaceae bacterium]
MTNPARYYPPIIRQLQFITGLFHGIPLGLARLGHQVTFFGRATVAIPFAMKQYRKEVWRLLSDVTWGNGAIVVGGGTLGVMILLGIFGGATVGIEGYTALNILGMGPVTGAISAFGTTRELGPLLAAIAFAAQSGCRFTAQLGSMRINEEVDALESIAIQPLPYLVSTRLIAASISILPLYLVGLAANYIACRLFVAFQSGKGSGTYLHYFYQFLASTDILYSILKAVIFVILTTLVQCYYGFNASGGPSGVGVAAGRAIRAAIVVIVFANLILTLLFWGTAPGIRISG